VVYIPEGRVAEGDFVVTRRPAVDLYVEARPAAGVERICPFRSTRAVDTPNGWGLIAGTHERNVRCVLQQIPGGIEPARRSRSRELSTLTLMAVSSSERPLFSP